MLAFVPIIPVVRTIEELHATEPASEGLNGRYSAVNVVTIIVGGIMLVLAIIGTLYPPPEGGDVVPGVEVSALAGFAAIEGLSSPGLARGGRRLNGVARSSVEAAD